MAKSFLSTQVDIYRPAYGRETVERPRQCVFFASSNEEKPLSGSNGNRRFRVVNLFSGNEPKLDVFSISKNDVMQIWGEAMAAYAEGESLELSMEMEAEARRLQKEHEEKDDREGLIREFLEVKLPENWEEMSVHERRSFIGNLGDKDFKVEGSVSRNRVCAAEIWVELLDKPRGEMEPYKVKFIYDVIRNLGGWGPSPKVKERFKLYGVQRTYVRLDDPD
jgi:predicted P-loop ATPase